MLAANFFVKILAWLFISALDWVAYLLLSVAYTIFVAVSQLDLFSAETAGEIYNTITARFYSALSVIMIFVFAYFLIMMIIDPDGGQKKASTQMVKDVVFSIILVIVLPTIFGYMSLFQKHVLTNNTIGALILGSNGTVDTSPGKQISMIVFTAFFHPQGTMYADYFDNNGEFIGKDNAISKCKGPNKVDGEDVSTNEDVCTAWAEGLEKWTNSESWGIGEISGKAKLRDTVGDEGGMEYLWVLSTVAAIAVAYFFFSYTLDVGTRAVKLGFLQLIAPVPVMLKMFPQTKKTFDTWFAEIKKCYLEIFLRVAVIFFIVLLCTMVPQFIGTIFGSTTGVEGNFLIKAIATVCLILGLLKFAKEAPGLLKTIFSSSTGLFAGVDFKPGVKRRISENEYAMKGMSAVGGAVGGAVGTGYMAFKNALKDSEVQGGADDRAMLSSIGKGLLSVPRGIISGGKAGFKNTPQEFNLKNMAGTFNTGATGGQSSYIHHENAKVFNVRKAELDAARNGTTVFEELKKQGIEKGWNPRIEDITEALKSEGKLLSGESVNSSAATETINKATKAIGDVMSWTDSKTKAYSDAYKDLEKKLIKEGTVDYNGVTYSLRGGQTTFDADAYKQALGGMSEIYDKAAYEAECRAQGMSPVSSVDPTSKYNPITKQYEKGFDVDSFIASQSNRKYNPQTKKYEDNFKPENMYTKTTKSLSDLKKIFDNEKNQIVADTLTKDYKEGTATYMATLREQLSKEVGNLGTETIAELTKNIRDKTNDQNATIDSYLKKLSDLGPNGQISSTDVEILGKMKSTLEQKGKNISIQAQIQQQAKQNASQGKSGGDKPKS